jgi:hypothetical protein
MFLNVLMLTGLGAAVVPLVLHLLSRARYRTVEWGAMLFLQGSDARQRQSRRFNQVLLVVVRTAMVALLALALARPVVSRSWVGGAAKPGKLTAAIVLDCSASMAYDENGGRTRFDLARAAARQVLAGLRRGDEAILVLAGVDPSQQDFRPTSEFRSIDARLSSLQPATGKADLPAAMNDAWQQLAAREPKHRQIFVITDRQALSWSSAAAASSASGAKPPWLDQPRESRVQTEVFVLPVGDLDADNIVVESLELVDPPAIRGQPVEFEVRLRNYGAVQRASLPLVLQAGGKTIYEAKVNLPPDSSASFRAPVRAGFATVGTQVVSASVTSTGYTADDRLDSVIETIEPVRVLILSGDERAGAAPAAGGGALRNESDFARVALAPFASATGQLGRDPCTVDVQPVEKWPADVSLTPYDVVILANVERFDARQVRDLEQFVYAGGGLLIAPGSLTRVDNYNETMYRGGSGLMPAELLPAVPGDGSQATSLLGWRPDHPVFRFLRGRPDPLPSSTIGRYFPCRPRQPDGRSIADYVSGWPFLVEAPRQERERRGRVMLITTPLDLDWGNLPYSNFYLPFMQSLARYLAGGPSESRELAPGEPIRATLDPPGPAPAAATQPLARSVTITRPGEAQGVPVEVLHLGDQDEIRYDDTRRPGEYRVVVNDPGQPPRTLHYVVAVPRDESDLTQLPEDRWRALEKAMGFQRVDTTEQPIAAVMSASRDGREIWPYLVVGVIALGVLELAMARSYSRVPKSAEVPS